MPSDHRARSQRSYYVLSDNDKVTGIRRFVMSEALKAISLLIFEILHAFMIDILHHVVFHTIPFTETLTQMHSNKKLPEDRYVFLVYFTMIFMPSYDR